MDAAASISGRPRVLVVDDLELNRTLTETVLRAADYDVDSVADGASAVAAVRGGRYDLVLMDLDMPGQDGFAAAEALRQTDCQLARIVAFSARAGAADRQRAARAGMSGHIGRPIGPRGLLSEIARLLLEPPIQVLPDAWDTSFYEDWTTRLGKRRVEDFLARLLEQFRALRVLTTLPTERSDSLHRLAHDVASTGGMLGFLDVTRRCQALQAAMETDAEAERARTALAAALESAIARLDAHLASRGSVFD